MSLLRRFVQQQRRGGAAAAIASSLVRPDRSSSAARQFSASQTPVSTNGQWYRQVLADITHELPTKIPAGSIHECRHGLASSHSAIRGMANMGLPDRRGIATMVLPQLRGMVLPQRRGMASMAERIREATQTFKAKTGDLKHAVMARPRSMVETAKQSEIVMGTKDAVSELSKPLSRTVMSYREAAKLQVEAFWRRNYLVVVGAAGLASCLLLWKIMFGFASMFVSLSEGLAKYGFLALAASTVGFAGMLFKARHTINPDAVYRIAMRKLNTSADVLKALGAPLAGTDIRAYVMTGGGLRIRKFKPRLSNKRCFLIFPIQGSEKKGLVSIETKKKDGQYDFKLLAVDVAGEKDRIYVVGDEVEYKVGGGLIAELRDPIVKAMAAQNEFEAQDDNEEDEEQATVKQSSL